MFPISAQLQKDDLGMTAKSDPLIRFGTFWLEHRNCQVSPMLAKSTFLSDSRRQGGGVNLCM